MDLVFSWLHRDETIINASKRSIFITGGASEQSEDGDNLRLVVHA